MKNKDKIQLLEHRLNIHSELLERIISKLEFDNEPKLKQLDHSVFNGLDSKWEYAAVDKNGKAHLYTHHIIPDSVEFTYCDYMDFDCEVLGTDYDATDWKNSLIKHETNELTGSELCKAMLARGDKYVMCVVGTQNYVVVIEGMYGSEFVAVGRTNSYCNPKPINNQGEPLTSSDVGL